MFLINWVFDKMGYMPKFSIDATFPFPATPKKYVAPEFEQPVKATKVAKKTTKATTRKKKA